MSLTPTISELREREAGFWLRVDRREPEKCWPWKLKPYATGYGMFFVCNRDGGRVVIGAHRASLILSFGTWGEVAMHSCDNRICCNPAHLSWGTKGDNNRDRYAKGRFLDRGNIKMSEEEVLLVRKMRAEGVAFNAIARAMGYDRGTVTSAIRGITWSRIPDGIIK